MRKNVPKEKPSYPDEAWLTTLQVDECSEPEFVFFNMRTLEKWRRDTRQTGELCGPKFLKIGGIVRYKAKWIREVFNSGIIDSDDKAAKLEEHKPHTSQSTAKVIPYKKNI